MNVLRPFFAAVALVLASSAFAADPSGLWKWSTPSPAGQIDTTLDLKVKDGVIVGNYSNQFGDTTISDAHIADDTITFQVVREFGGQKYIVKYSGKLEGDAINGTLEAPGHDGGQPLKIEWHAHRASENSDKSPAQK